MNQVNEALKESIYRELARGYCSFMQDEKNGCKCYFKIYLCENQIPTENTAVGEYKCRMYMH
jgi:hypothetical protein